MDNDKLSTNSPKAIKILDDDDDPNIGAELNSQSDKYSENFQQDE